MTQNKLISKSLFGNFVTEDDKKYTTKVEIPQYLPSVTCPLLDECYNLSKYRDLIEKIDKSNVSTEEKIFLKFAATRHIVFTYAKIADYYAHASKEMQELMEQSALVIIDFNDAIANGYVKLSKNIEKIMRETGRQVKEDYHNQTTPKKG